MVALVNHGKAAHNITVEWKTLGFDDGKKAVVVDVWDASERSSGRVRRLVHFACTVSRLSSSEDYKGVVKSLGFRKMYTFFGSKTRRSGPV